MPPSTGKPMDLNNIRSLGVTKVEVYCGCGHQATIDVSDLPLFALYQTFPPAGARGILRRLEFHYTPKHASWLNMLEIEIGVLRGQWAVPLD
jgi:hypothetical protein